MTTTFRSDVRAGAYALLTAFAAANPSYALSVFRTRPAAFGDRPLAFVGGLDETIIHTGNTLYQRNLNPELVFVWASSADALELADVRDDLIDGLVGYMATRLSATAVQTRAFPTRVQDVELELDGAFYPASIVTIDGLSLEGSA